jgi:hypothetical protein
MTTEPEIPELVARAYDLGAYNTLVALEYALLTDPRKKMRLSDLRALLAGTKQVIVEEALAEGRDLTPYLTSADEVDGLPEP